PQELTTRTVAEQAPAGPPGEGLGLACGVGLTLGLTCGLGLMLGLGLALGEGDGLVVGPPHAVVESSQAARRSIQSSMYCTWPSQVGEVGVKKKPIIGIVRFGQRWKLRCAALVSGRARASTRLRSEASESRPRRSDCQRTFTSLTKAGSCMSRMNQSLA